MKKDFQILSKYAGEAGALYILEKQKEHPFHFKITKPRNSKEGDFRYYSDPKRIPQISVNGNLNRYNFLFTFVHEYAHLLARLKFGPKHAPHGKEWKKEFAITLKEAIGRKLFSKDVEDAMLLEIDNLKASNSGNKIIYKALENHNDDSSGHYLENLPKGTEFKFRNKWYVLEEQRRTRYVCKQKNTNKKYLINGIVKVEINE